MNLNVVYKKILHKTNSIKYSCSRVLHLVDSKINLIDKQKKNIKQSGKK